MTTLTRSLITFVLFLCAILINNCWSQISPIANGSWQNPTIWPSNQIPNANDDILIPSGLTIGLIGQIEVKTITVQGQLRALNGNPIDLKTEWLMVSGNGALLEIGTESNPFDTSCVITLKGIDDGDNIMGMGDKFIGAMNRAQIELHGSPKVSWTKLDSSVSNGTNRITLTDPIDWSVGDEIVIVASRGWNEAEKKTITAISSDRKTLLLNSNLSFPHSANVYTYTRNTDNKTWTADLRVEVGLLTHNIKIQGDSNSITNGFGGHIMAMSLSSIKGSDLELHRMGQKSKLGRYPWHWHLLHTAATGQYFKNSSVHTSYNRAITIHGSSYVTVENNFFYDHIGHGVFLEDGSERFNTIKNNVVLLSKRPATGEELTPSDNELNEVQNRTPSSYWITNPNNYFEGNVAAGTEGTGFWFAFPQSPMGSSASDPTYNGIEPYKEPLGLFKKNTAHSCMSGFDVFDQLNPDHSIKKNAGWQDSSLHFIDSCTWYGNNLALYSGIGGGVGSKITYTSNLIFRDNILFDNVTAMQLASYSQVQESAIIASGTLPIVTSLYRIYDGAGQIRNCHLVGWNGPLVDYLKDGGAATKHTNHRLSGITTDDGLPPKVEMRDYDLPVNINDSTPQSLSHPRVWNMVLRDEDGSFSGVANSSIVSNHPWMLVGDEFQPSNWINAYRSPHKFALSLLEFPGLTAVNYPNVTCTRSKAGTPSRCFYFVYGYKEHVQFPFIVNEGFLYQYQFESLPANKRIMAVLDDAEIGDTCLIRFKDFGKLGGLNLTTSSGTLTSHALLNNLVNSNQTGYHLETNGDLYIKFVATNIYQAIDLTWTQDFTVPILDTDQDSLSDRNEIINGTDPCTNDILSNLSLQNNTTTIYPNPTYKGQLVQIDVSDSFHHQDVHVLMYDRSGKLIHQFHAISKYDIRLSTQDLAPGLYIIQLSSSEQTEHVKLMIH